MMLPPALAHCCRTPTELAAGSAITILPGASIVKAPTRGARLRHGALRNDRILLALSAELPPAGLHHAPVAQPSDRDLPARRSRRMRRPPDPRRLPQRLRHPARHSF